MASPMVSDLVCDTCGESSSLGGAEQLWSGGRISDLFGPVLRIGNRDGNYSYAATIELRKNFGSALDLRAGYSLTRSSDLQDLLSIDVTSNYATTPINLDPNDPVPQRSRFDRPHKVVASARTRILPRLGGTEISVLYVGQSGVPYSYVYEGDVNGDGFNGPRATGLANDLVYIPERLSDFPGSIVNQILWSSLIEEEDCLREQVMRILARNTCETPWSNRVDLRASHNFETPRILGRSDPRHAQCSQFPELLVGSRADREPGGSIVPGAQGCRARRKRPG